MMGEIHITREVVERILSGEGLSREERRVLLEHLTNSGSCKQCSGAVDDSDDQPQFEMLLDRLGHLQLEALRRRIEAGDSEAEHELMDLRFAALKRQIQKGNARLRPLAGVNGRLLNLSRRIFGGEEEKE